MFEKWRGAAWLTENVTDELIRLENLVKIYDTGAIRVLGLKKNNLTIRRGEFVAIMGHSGSGKSTLMNILGCLDVPTYGDYILNGTDVTDRTDRQLAHIRNKEIGFIFQGYNLIPALTAYENVELPLIYQGISVFQRKERVMAALAGGHGRPLRPPALRDVRRPAAASRHRPGHRHPSAHHHGR